jgi:hypothetical protein
MLKKSLVIGLGLLFIVTTIFPMVFGINTSTSNIQLSQLDPQDEDVELLWIVDDTGAGETIDTALINDDDYPDILACKYALDGRNGEIIYEFEKGFYSGNGDVNNDGLNEIITSNDGDWDGDWVNDIYCLNGYDGSLIWEITDIECSGVQCVSIGDVTGDSTNEIAVGLDDVFLLDGKTGNILWTKKIAFDSFSTIQHIEIVDINNDGENEIIAGTSNNDARICCLEGDNGDIIWEYKRNWAGGAGFKSLCIDNFNDDPYLEIIAKGTLQAYDYGIMCLSGYDGRIQWIWKEDPSQGSFQSILSADLISSNTGKEIIASGVGGVYCLYGGDDPPVGGRVIWHGIAGEPYSTTSCIIESAAIGDIDGDGLLDVIASTCSMFSSGGAGVYALNGQYGSLLWYNDSTGFEWPAPTITCVDINRDSIDEVVLINNYWIDTFLYHYYITAFKSNFPTVNQAPEKPMIYGPENGRIIVEHEYRAVSFDADDDYLYYYFDWGDGTGDILPSCDSGEYMAIHHSWNIEGDYIIKVKAIDEHGKESSWSEPLTVTMPRSRSIRTIFLEKILNLFPNLF